MNKKLEMVLRIVLGIALVVFGANKFNNFMGMPAPPEGSFMAALFGSGYLMKLVGISEIIPGLLLIFNKWKGFALAWLVPISVNIVAFHLFKDIGGIGLAAVIAILNFVLIYMNWDKFKGLFN
jgi:uncharacterized membrane protein YphA (DoxX/SURF4 family)